MNSFDLWWEGYVQTIIGKQLSLDDLLEAYKAGMLRAAEICSKGEFLTALYCSGLIKEEAESIK